MAYNNDFTQFMTLITQRFGEEIGCHVQNELANLTNVSGIDITGLKAKIDIIDSILDGGNADTQSAARNIIGMLGDLSTLNTTDKTSLVGAINELKSAIDSGAYNGTDGTNGTNGTNGTDGQSAYQLAVANGFVGTVIEWLGSLNGANGTNGTNGVDGTNGTNGVDGTNGTNGASAYELWIAEGNSGTKADFIAALKGATGIDGTNGVDGTNGTNGTNGASAYELWIAEGNSGTNADFIASLKGVAGQDGTNGTNGVDGAAGTNGVDGAAGKSAYELAVIAGFVGTETEWLASLQGQDVSTTLLDTKVDKSEMTAILGNVESLITVFKTGLATGKQANIDGTCAQLATGTTTGNGL